MSDECSSCGKPYGEHDGLIRTCKKLERARSALKVIQVWAQFENGIVLNPKDVRKLCDKALKETE